MSRRTPIRVSHEGIVSGPESHANRREEQGECEGEGDVPYRREAHGGLASRRSQGRVVLSIVTGLIRTIEPRAIVSATKRAILRVDPQLCDRSHIERDEEGEGSPKGALALLVSLGRIILLSLNFLGSAQRGA